MHDHYRKSRLGHRYISVQEQKRLDLKRLTLNLNRPCRPLQSSSRATQVHDAGRSLKTEIRSWTSYEMY